MSARLDEMAESGEVDEINDFKQFDPSQNLNR